MSGVKSTLRHPGGKFMLNAQYKIMLCFAIYTIELESILTSTELFDV